MHASPPPLTIAAVVFPDFELLDLFGPLEMLGKLDDRFFSSSGVSAGMDMTLGLIAHLFSRDEALQVAKRTEYIWNEDKSSDPFA